MTEPRSDIVKWGDAAMFEAEPMLKTGGARVTPSVFLLSATPDPLGAIAAGFRMYGGKPTYDLSDISDEGRKWAWEESLKTHLKAPWEFVDFHFFIEGVTRSFTHQMVRQRTAVYAQESLRFAVKKGFASEVARPPSIVGSEGPAKIWEDTVQAIEAAYEQLVNAGIPAEDARSLLPHCVTTRLNYKTTLRGLIEHAGNRLCTQAQFEWRAVFLGIMKAIREYNPPPSDPLWLDDSHDRPYAWNDNKWQFELIAQPIAQTFTPVCYKLNRCPYMGTLDRGCTIRDRVNEGRFGDIDPLEWAANPLAGLTTETNRPVAE